jgi:hypothetical protein
VVLWLSFRAVENTDVFARAYREVFTASLKDSRNTTVIVVCTVFLRSNNTSTKRALKGGPDKENELMIQARESVFATLRRGVLLPTPSLFQRQPPRLDSKHPRLSRH